MTKRAIPSVELIPKKKLLIHQLARARGYEIKSTEITTSTLAAKVATITVQNQNIESKNMLSMISRRSEGSSKRRTS